MPISIFVTVIVSYIWVYFLEHPDPELVPNYSLAVVWYACASVIFLLTEPLYIVSQMLLFVRAKVANSFIKNRISSVICSRCFPSNFKFLFQAGLLSTGIILRGIVTVFLVWFFPQYGVLNFCYAQV